MKGLLLKDYLVLTRHMKLFLILIPIMAIVGGVSMASIAILIGAMLPMTAMAYDEQAKWNDLAVMMPYSKYSIVLSKYVLGYLSMAGAALLFTITQLVIHAAVHLPLGESFSMILFAISCGLLLIAVQIPVALKFGIQKSRIIFVLFVGVSTTAGMLFQDAFPTISRDVVSLFPMIMILTAVILNVISAAVSLRIKQA